MTDAPGRSPTSREWHSAEDLLPKKRDPVEKKKANQTKNGFLYAGLVLVVLALGVGYGLVVLDQQRVKKAVDQTQSRAGGEQEQKYVSDEYGFGFSYAENMRVNDSLSDWLQVIMDGEEQTAINVLVFGDSSRQASLTQLALEEVQVGCSGDGPAGSVYCGESFEGVSSFTSSEGEKGLAGKLELTTTQPGANDKNETLDVYFFQLDPAENTGVVFFGVSESANSDVESLAREFFVFN